MSEKIGTPSKNADNALQIMSPGKAPEQSKNSTHSNPIHEKIDEVANNFKNFPVIGEIIVSLADHLKGLVNAITGNTNLNLNSLKSEITKGKLGNVVDAGMSLFAPAISTQESEENSENTRRGISITDEDAKEWIEKSKLGENYKTATEFFVKKGLSLEQSIGIVANLHHESGLRTTAVGDQGKAKGIAQWHPDRRRAILKGTGIDVATASLEKQLEGLWWEITKGNEKKTYEAIKNSKTAEEAAKQFCLLFERPADKHKQANKRALYASKIMNSNSQYNA